MRAIENNFSKVVKHLVSEYWPLLLILFLGIFFRFWNIFERYSVGYESIRDMVVGIQGAKSLQLPLTGPFSSLGHFTFGPWYWYLLIFFYLIFPHIYSAWLLMSLLSVAQIFFMYKIGEELEGKSLAIVLGTLAALTGYFIETSASLSNPNPLHFFAAGAIWFFLKAIKYHASLWWSFLMGLWIGIGFFTHYQMVAYLIFPVFLLPLKKFQIKPLIMGGAGLFISWLPMLVFDLLNHWHMVRNMVFTYQDVGNRIYVPNSWRIYLFDFWPSAWTSFWHIPNFLAYPTMIGVAVLTIFFLWKGKASWKVWLMSLIFALVFVHLRYYKGSRFMGYVHYTFPFLLIFTGIAIVSLRSFKLGKYLFPLVFGSIIILMAPLAFAATKTNPIGIEYRRVGEILAENYSGKTFTPYRCTKEPNADPILSLLFVLEMQGMLSDQGTPIFTGESQCLSKLGSKSQSETIDFNKADFYPEFVPPITMSQTDEVTLEKVDFQKYTLEGLYQEYTGWWFIPTLHD